MPPLFLLLCLLPLWMEAQPAVLDCSFDPMHRHRLAKDSDYQHRQKRIDAALLNRARERRQSVDRRDEDSIYRIAVVVHIFYAPGTPEGSMSRPGVTQVIRSIDRLNDGFRNRGDYSGEPLYSDAGIPAADVGIEFQLASTAPDGTPSRGIFETPTLLTELPIDERINGREVLDSLRRLSGWPTDRYLNIYVLPDLCDQNGDCPVGFAYQAAAHGREDDGVYVFSKALISETEILIHELGHYLNLYHTFETGCAEEDCLTGGDRICDTPPDCYPTRCSGQIPNCLKGDRQNTCSNDAYIANSPFTRDVEDLYENFMDYGFWKCFNSFTPGQRLRMRDALLLFRRSLLEAPKKDSCTIKAVELLSVDSCLMRSDTGTALVRIDYANPPDSGKLLVNGWPFGIRDSVQYIPLPVSASDTPQSLSAFFSADPGCRFQADSILWLPPCAPTFRESCRSAPLLPVARTDACREERWFTPERISAGEALPGLCTPFPGRVQWVRLAVPETGELRLSARTADDRIAPAVAVFNHCDSLPLICRKADAGENLVLMLEKLRYGDTLRVAVWPSEHGNSADIGLCAYLPVPPPVNDECTGALPLPLSDPRLGQTCNRTSPVEWRGALNSSIPDTCTPAAAGDVWFYVVVPEAGALRIRTLGEGAVQTGITAYGDCGETWLACAEQDRSTGTELYLEGLEPRDTVRLRVYPLLPYPGEVRLCATIPAVAAANDYCEQALPLSVNSPEGCQAQLFAGNVIVSSSGRANNCKGEAVEDLWYRVTVPPVGKLVVKAQTAAGILSPGLAAYRGCDGERLACHDPEGEQAILELEGLTPGDTIIIALWDFFRFRFGSVAICAQLPPPPPNDRCENASVLPLCSGSNCAPMIVQDLQQATTTRAYPGPECDAQARGELWYKMPAPENGRLLLELFPRRGSTAGLSAYLSCQSAPLGCLNSEDDEDGQLLLTDLPQGDTLLIAVWSLSDSTGIRAASPACSRFELSLLVDSISCYQATDGSAVVIKPDTSSDLSFQWSTGDIGPVISQLNAGEYSVTVSNAMQCRDTLQFSLSEPPPLTGYAESTATPPGAAAGKTLVTASGGTPPYRYQLGERPIQEQPVFDSLAADTYILHIIDANGCSRRDTIEVGLLTTMDRLSPNVQSLRLFPNPAKDFLQLELILKKPAPVNWTLLDLTGRRIRSGQLPPERRHDLRLSLRGLPAGVYAILLETGGKLISRRVRKD